MHVERLSGRDGSLFQNYGDHIQRYAFAVSYCQKKRVLDAGCGVGYGAFHLAANGATSVTAVDISDKAIAEAIRDYSASNITFKKWDVCELDGLNETFDVIVNFENIEHISFPRKLISSARKSLASDGVFICSSPNGELTKLDSVGRPVNKFHVQEYTREQLIAMLSSEFSEIEMFGQYLNYEGQARHRVKREKFQRICNRYYNPIRRAWRFLRETASIEIESKPEYIFDTIIGDYSILPYEDTAFGQKPAMLIAVSRNSH